MKIILLMIGMVFIMSGCKSTNSEEKPPVSLEYYHKTFGTQAIKSINKDPEVIIGKKQVYNDLFNAVDEYFKKQGK